VRLDLNEEFVRPIRPLRTDGDIQISLESILAEGTYQCEASNQYGAYYTPFTLRSWLIERSSSTHRVHIELVS